MNILEIVKIFFFDRRTKEVWRKYVHVIWCYYIRILRHVTGLLLKHLCKNIVKMWIWKFTDIHVFPNKVLNFWNIFTEHGKILLIIQKAQKEVQGCFVGISYCWGTIKLHKTILTLGGWLAGCLGFNGSLKQYFSIHRAISQKEKKENRWNRGKTTESTVGPCLQFFFSN